MKTRIALGIFGLGLISAALVPQIYQNRKATPVITHRNHGFYCATQAAPNLEQDVWTVMYQDNGKNTKPWFRITEDIGDIWSPKDRCEQVARRLEIYRQDGLLSFEYKKDKYTPDQYVICAKTQVNKDSCPLVLTLTPKDDPYQALRDVAGSLLSDGLPNYQCNQETCPIPKPIDIGLKSQLVSDEL